VVFVTKVLVWKILSSKIYGYYFDTLYGGVRWKILFKLSDGKKICLFKTYLKILGWIVVCRDVGREVEKWGMVIL